MNLRTRLTLITAGLVVLALATFAGLAGVLLWRAEVSSISHQVTAQLGALLVVAQRSPDTLRASAEDILENDGLTSVARVYRDGDLLWAGGAAGPDTLDVTFLNNQGYAERLSIQGGYMIASHRSGDMVVQVGRSLRPLEQTLTRYMLVAGLSLLLLALLAAVLVAWQVRRTLLPLERLVQRVQRLDEPSEVPGTASPDEVGELARALSQSLANLRAERERESYFLASASHELRTPVTAMLADLQHTLSRERPPAEVLAALQRTEKTALRLRQLTGNLMTLTRAQRLAGGMAAHSGQFQQADLLELAGEATDLLQPLAMQRHIELWLDGAPSLVNIDSTLVSGVLENLIGNALKFTPSGGQVEVTVRPLEAQAELLVEDTGAGFPAGNLTEAFVRGQPQGTQVEGFGLGLAVVRQVVSAHGGSLELGPREGGGARVRVLLPLAG